MPPEFPLGYFHGQSRQLQLLARFGTRLPQFPLIRSVILEYLPDGLPDLKIGLSHHGDSVLNLLSCIGDRPHYRDWGQTFLRLTLVD